MAEVKKQELTQLRDIQDLQIYLSEKVVNSDWISTWQYLLLYHLKAKLSFKYQCSFYTLEAETTDHFFHTCGAKPSNVQIFCFKIPHHAQISSHFLCHNSFGPSANMKLGGSAASTPVFHFCSINLIRGHFIFQFFIIKNAYCS